MTAGIKEKAVNVQYTESTIQFPDGMQFVFDTDDDTGATFERDALMLYPYVLKGRISNGRAAEILGVHKWDLIEWYESQGLMCLVTTIEDVQQDIETLRGLKEGV